MQKEDFLKAAIPLISGIRNHTHGDAFEQLKHTGVLWSAYLDDYVGKEFMLSPVDVAMMMVLMKMSRSQFGEYNSDDFIDMAGYTGIAGECRLRLNAEKDSS